MLRHSGPPKPKFSFDLSEWVRPFPGIDYPREIDWLEVKRIFGGAIMTVGMD